PVDDRLRAEAVPQPVQLRVLGDAGDFPGPSHTQAQVRAVPGRLAVRLEDTRARVLAPPDVDQQLEDHRVQRDDTRLLLPVRAAGLVAGDGDDRLVEVDVMPLQAAGLAGPGPGEAQEDQQLPEAGPGRGAEPALAVRRPRLPAPPPLDPDGGRPEEG